MNQLPTDCRLAFHPDFLSQSEERSCLAYLDGLPALKDRRMTMADGTVREIGMGSFMLGDAAVLGYDSLVAAWGARAPWPALMLPIKRRVEALAGRTFHVGRCVYYEDGDVGIDYHTDPPAYGDTSVIASLSLGEERMFSLRSIADPSRTYDVSLASGSLFIMGEGCQERYEHALLVDASKRGSRFNVTFRQFGFDA